MSYLVANVPPIEVWIDKRYLYDFQKDENGNLLGEGEWEKGHWVSVKSIPNRALLFETYIDKFGAVYDKLPISAFRWDLNSLETEYPLDFLQLWDCLSYNISVIEKRILRGTKTYTTLKDSNLLFNPVTGVLTVNGIQFLNTAQTTTGLPRSAQTYLNSPTSQSVAAYTVTDIAGLRATITPSSIDAKILVVIRWFGELGSAGTVWDSMFGLTRDGAIVGNQDPVSVGARMPGMATNTSSYNHAANADSTPEVLQYYYIDSPGTTNPVTYQATFQATTAQTLYTNRTVADTDTAASYDRGTSNIFLMEVI